MKTSLEKIQKFFQYKEISFSFKQKLIFVNLIYLLMAANLENKIQKTIEGKKLSESDLINLKKKSSSIDKEKYEDSMLIARLENYGFPQGSCPGVIKEDPTAEIGKYACSYTNKKLYGKMICKYCLTQEKAENCSVYKAHEA